MTLHMEGRMLLLESNYRHDKTSRHDRRATTVRQLANKLLSRRQSEEMQSQSQPQSTSTQHASTSTQSTSALVRAKAVFETSTHVLVRHHQLQTVLHNAVTLVLDTAASQPAPSLAVLQKTAVQLEPMLAQITAACKRTEEQIRTDPGLAAIAASKATLPPAPDPTAIPDVATDFRTRFLEAHAFNKLFKRKCAILARQSERYLGSVRARSKTLR